MACARVLARMYVCCLWQLSSTPELLAVLVHIMDAGVSFTLTHPCMEDSLRQRQ